MTTIWSNGNDYGKEYNPKSKANEMGRVSDSWNDADIEQRNSIIEQLQGSVGEDSVPYAEPYDDFDDQSFEFQELLKKVDFEYLLSDDQMGLNHERDRARSGEAEEEETRVINGREETGTKKQLDDLEAMWNLGAKMYGRFGHLSKKEREKKGLWFGDDVGMAKDNEVEHDGTVWSDFHQKWIDEDELKKDRKARGFGESKANEYSVIGNTPEEYWGYGGLNSIEEDIQLYNDDSQNASSYPIHPKPVYRQNTKSWNDLSDQEKSEMQTLFHFMSGNADNDFYDQENYTKANEVHGSSVNGYDAKEFKNFCLVCAGRGFMFPTGAKCPNCHGTGVYDSEREYKNPPPPISRDPNNPKYSPLSDQEPRTAGGGRLYEAVCEDCMGSGTKKVYNKHRVRAGDDGSFRSGHFKADYEFPCKKCSGGGYVKKEDQANTILGSEPKWQVAEGTEIEDVVPTDPYAYGNQSDREWVDPDASSDPNDDSYSSATGGYGMTEDQLYADYYSGMKEAIDREIPRMFEESGSWNYWQNLIWGWSQNVAIFGTPYSVRNSPEGLSAFQKAHKAIKQYVTDKKQEVQGTLASPSWEGRPKDKRQTQIFNAPPDNLSRLGNLKQEGDPDWTTTPDPSGNTWNEFGQKEKTSRSNYTQYHDRPRGKAEQDANRGDIEHDSLEDPLAWYNNESKVKATELDGDYVFEGEIVGRVTDFKPDEWFGKVLLFNMGEENSEYGYLDPQATVKGDDGETYEDPKGGSDGSRGTLLHDVESNLSPHNSNIVGTDRRGDYGYKACSDCKGPVALDSWGEPDESCQSCNTGGDPTNQSVEGQTVRQMTGHTGEADTLANSGDGFGDEVDCPQCNGTGIADTLYPDNSWGKGKCDMCNGTGKHIEGDHGYLSRPTGEAFTVSSPDRKQLLNQMYEDMEIDEGDCEKCKGTGLANQDDDTNCSHCDGYGLKGMKGEVKYGDKEKEHLDKIKEESEEDLSIDLKPKTEDDISQSNKDHQLLEHFR